MVYWKQYSSCLAYPRNIYRQRKNLYGETMEEAIYNYLKLRNCWTVLKLSKMKDWEQVYQEAHRLWPAAHFPKTREIRNLLLYILRGQHRYYSSYRNINQILNLPDEQ